LYFQISDKCLKGHRLDWKIRCDWTCC